MSIKVNHLDHLVLTVRDIQRTVDFYCQVMGMQAETFANNRIALKYGNQKINLHKLGNEFEPKANCVTAGSADLCFIIDTPLQTACNHLQAMGIEITEGPVERTGANGPILSIYLRDPDGNLIELSNPTDSN